MSSLSYFITFFPYGIGAIFMAIDMFTELSITPEMINLLLLMIPSTTVGGLVKKGFDVYQAGKKPS